MTGQHEPLWKPDIPYVVSRNETYS